MILVLSAAQTIAANVSDAVGTGVTVRTRELDARLTAADDDIDVVIVDATVDVEAALAAARNLDETRPELTIVVCAEPDAVVIARAMQCGARDVFPPGADSDRIREAVKRALEVAERRQRSMGWADEPDDRRLIMVISPKGGAGKTTVATNLAVGLASRAPKEVVLVDGDLQFGDVGNALRLLSETSIRDAVAGGLRDVAEVKVHLTAHSSGLFALCAPEVPGVADEITPQAFAKAVSLLAREFRFVVVDTDPGLGERTLSVMDHATDLVFIGATDVASVRGLHKTLEALDSIGMTNQKRHFVLNRADAKVGLEVSDIIATVGMEPDVLVPSSRTLPVSLNQGTPVLELDDKSPAVAPLWGLVDRFEPDPANESDGDPSRRGGLLRRRHA